jgi:hypothetical protein
MNGFPFNPKFVSVHIREEKEQPRRKLKWGLQRPIVKKKTLDCWRGTPTLRPQSIEKSKPYSNKGRRKQILSFDSNINKVTITGHISVVFN